MKKIILLLFTAAVLAACGQTDNTSSSSDEVVQSIKADLKVPENAGIGDKVTFKVSVKQDGKAIEDADEVKFEIWKNGAKNKSDMIEAEHTSGGIYVVKKTFDQKGIYYVQSHVTANQMHTMPKKKINIGNAKANKDRSGEKHEHGHHHSQTKVNFNPPETITAGKKTTFTVNVSTKEKPLQNGSVTLEIWQENQDKHQWLNMTEQSGGTYKGKTTFDKTGAYQIKVHVKKDDIHYHKVFKTKVK
ncbi:FixH family protein [Virgibacillus siamensis]|uniref:FixH family protein n=1 Tax=Virgibacillus siamensis TaxID=480071 RepID=UPI00158BFBD8|nr:FixH family protein [Virgibacillus siamensis]